MKKQEIIGAKETLYTECLDNGLKIFMLPNDKIKNFYITLNVKYGSIYTNYKINGKTYNDPKGIAHYMEHLKFNNPDYDVMELYNKLGSYINAYTSHDITCYEVFANSKFKENLTNLIKYVYTPYFTKELVNKERGIISEEINMGKDNPSKMLMNMLSNNIYINDERKYMVTGDTNDIKEITKEHIENVFNTFYNPHNMFVVITGNFNPEEAVAIISEEMKKIKFNEYSEHILKSKNEPFKINNEYEEKESNVNKNKIAIGYKIPKDNFKSLKLSDLELKLYLNLIVRVNFGSTSILNEEMKSNGIISASIGNRLIETDQYFIICFMGETDYSDYFIKRIKETFNNLLINQENVERKIKSSISNLIYLFDDIDAVNTSIISDILNYDTVITDTYSIYKSLNEETAKKVINKLNKNLCSVNIIKPLENK